MRRYLIPIVLLLCAASFSQTKHPFTFEDMMALKRVGEPLPSPDGTWIYFVRGVPETLELDLWRIKAAGGQPERLTQNNKYIGFPTPLDSRIVLYIAEDGDGSGPWLWVLDVETKVTRRITSGLERYTSIAASVEARRLVAAVANPGANLWSVPILERTLPCPRSC